MCTIFVVSELNLSDKIGNIFDMDLSRTNVAPQFECMNWNSNLKWTFGDWHLSSVEFHIQIRLGLNTDMFVLLILFAQIIIQSSGCIFLDAPVCGVDGKTYPNWNCAGSVVSTLPSTVHKWQEVKIWCVFYPYLCSI